MAATPKPTRKLMKDLANKTKASMKGVSKQESHAHKSKHVRKAKELGKSKRVLTNIRNTYK